MKKHGILNRDIARVLAQMGHTDSIVIADCGLPVPADVECIDLSVRIGTPDFFTVLDAVLDDFQCEKALFAREAQARNPAVAARASAMAAAGCRVSMVSHEDLKLAARGARAVIRTGEATPYANVVLHSGVIF